MSIPSEGGPAFPQIYEWAACEQCGHHQDMAKTGMSLRDWFAGQVLATEWLGDFDNKEAAKRAYMLADAMLAEREKQL